MNCPLCCSDHLQHLEEIPGRHLANLYKTRLGIDVDSLLPKHASIDYMACRECDLRFFSPAITGDERFYNALQVHPWYYLDAKAEYRHAAGLIQREDRVLDVGCGKAAFAGLIPSNQYTGLDFSVEAAALAARRGTRILNQTVEQHAQHNAGAYDVVASFQVLEHVAEVRSFLSAAVDCLKPNGLLILAVPSFDSFLGMAENAVLNLPPHHVTHWTDRALESIADLLQLRKPEIWHEELSSLHAKWYSNTVTHHQRLNRWGLTSKQVAGALSEKIIRKLIRLTNVGGQEIQEVSTAGAVRGHTVVATYRKGRQ